VSEPIAYRACLTVLMKADIANLLPRLGGTGGGDDRAGNWIARYDVTMTVRFISGCSEQVKW
jgi:hypothetical protein